MMADLLMSITFLIITAVAVSIDAFFCGLTVSVKKSNKFVTLSGVNLSIFIICSLGSLLGNLFGEYFQNFANLTSGIVFLSIGFLGLFSSNSKQRKELANSFIKSLILGFSVGLDGALGCFTLTTLGYNAFLATFTVWIVHVIFMALSIFIGNAISQKFKFSKVFSPIILIALGVYKIVCLL